MEPNRAGKCRRCAPAPLPGALQSVARAVGAVCGLPWCLWELAVQHLRSVLCLQDSLCYTKEQRGGFNVFFQAGTDMPCNRGVPVLQVLVNMCASSFIYPELKEAEENLILIILISKLFYLLFYI